MMVIKIIMIIVSNITPYRLIPGNDNSRTEDEIGKDISAYHTLASYFVKLRKDEGIVRQNRNILIFKRCRLRVSWR